jgi:trehalose 6-phosphate phosphatase
VAAPLPLPETRPAPVPSPAELQATFPIAVQACKDALTHRPAALITDVDGTISPIALDPTAATVMPGCREALAVLTRHLEVVAVLTGRSPEVAVEMVGLSDIEYFGTHGMEEWTPEGNMVHPTAARFVDVINRVTPVVRAELRYPGIIVERKGPTLAVHYRQTLDPAQMRQTILQTLGPIANEAGLAVYEGRMVVELRPPPPLGKGWTVEDIARYRRVASLVYLGDDRTDIEAFEAVRDWREEAPGRYGVTLAVASTEMPPALALVADYVVDGVPAVELLLRELARSYS